MESGIWTWNCQDPIWQFWSQGQLWSQTSSGSTYKAFVNVESASCDIDGQLYTEVQLPIFEGSTQAGLSFGSTLGSGFDYGLKVAFASTANKQKSILLTYHFRFPILTSG